MRVRTPFESRCNVKKISKYCSEGQGYHSPHRLSAPTIFDIPFGRSIARERLCSFLDTVLAWMIFYACVVATDFIQERLNIEGYKWSTSLRNSSSFAFRARCNPVMIRDDKGGGRQRSVLYLVNDANLASWLPVIIGLRPNKWYHESWANAQYIQPQGVRLHDNFNSESLSARIFYTHLFLS